MKLILQLEDLFLFLLSIYLLYLLNVDWWVYLILFIGPDISMLGYLGGNKLGAVSYNLFHHKAVAVVLAFLGILFSLNIFLIAGIIIFGHSSMDRMFGYGLKYFTGFHHTHLGNLNSVKEQKIVERNEYYKKQKF